jgi:tRNA-uridine 2-sulfurtransferase
MNESNSTKHVLVAMSGGVDSSMAAALLLEQGYRVTGMMLHLWCENEEDNKCCTPEAIGQARGVAAQLGIPFYVTDAETNFRRIVVEHFYESYLSGKTPNPCYICNQQFRWSFLLKWAESIGADALATGHYARIQRGVDGSYQLLRGLDDWKDQSYMLSGLNQAQLSKTILPLGEMRKTDIREKARQLNLSVADKEDSQDLCFLGNQDYRDFLKMHKPEVNLPGNIVRRNGDVVGKHEGLAFYTIGQRKGLGVTSPDPLYVLEKNVTNNELIVGQEEELGRVELAADSFNWVSGKPLASPQNLMVKIRYRSDFHPGKVEAVGTDFAKITFDQPLRDITPGQIAVVYNGDQVVGSGIIRL